MDWLEQELKHALARKDPPPGFAARVRRAAGRSRVFTMPRWMAATAALLVVTGAGIGWREHRGRVAKEQVMMAVRITAVQLNRIQTRVREVRP
ncbi:MAG TPA: hypothetical protein VE959_23120 [Bryobacteraceae bacterium]|nr:hypothetical protein [Bryobacteraceae bacterium]